ncbi:hypothetical protein FQR65_LT00261 [Abscondita terminalis]|nr:hypothetical protein FQR65_LT00261 [Abscondita terminalis]
MYEHYFNKSYEFVGNELWILPEKAYCTPPWSIDALQQMKSNLNTIKGQLNLYPLTAWSNHTKKTDPSSLIKHSIGGKLKIEIFTQAWCKFYECLNTYSLIPMSSTLNTVHLCEAPGAFVSALNYYLHTNHPKIEWKWNANTLNPYYEGNSPSEMISDDSLIRQTIANWEFGSDQTGDIRNYDNHTDLVAKFSEIDLVTADGSVDCMQDPGEQEAKVHHLHYCEVVTALRLLRTGGNFVLKLFTMFEHGAISLMYLLNCCFKQVDVFKPCSSKSGNSEVYIICTSYRGFNLLTNIWDSLTSPYKTPKVEAMFDVTEINPTFLMQLEECAHYFMDLQCEHINRNIELYGTDHSNPTWNCVKDVQKGVAKTYSNLCRITNIPKKRRLLRRIHNDDDDVVRINIGRAFDTIQTSCFGSISKKTPLHECPLNTSAVINNSLFESEITQSAFHHRFFRVMLEVRNIGVVYILSLGYDSFDIQESAIVFKDYNHFKFYSVRKHLEKIANKYEQLESNQDILEVVPLRFLKSGSFYKAICKYNNLDNLSYQQVQNI